MLGACGLGQVCLASFLLKAHQILPEEVAMLHGCRALGVGPREAAGLSQVFSFLLVWVSTLSSSEIWRAA